jgi:hypothetical protein
MASPYLVFVRERLSQFREASKKKRGEGSRSRDSFRAVLKKPFNFFRRRKTKKSHWAFFLLAVQDRGEFLGGTVVSSL